MIENIFDTLNCPYCASKLKAEHVIDGNEKRIINGIVHCDCTRYPIVDSILVIRKNKQMDYAVASLETGRSRDALLTMLSSGRDAKLTYLYSELPDVHIPFLNIFHRCLLLYKRILYKSYFKNESATFCKIIDWWKLSWGDYLKYRFSSPTFLSAVPLISLMNGADNYVLDLGCGMGHTTYLMSQFLAGKHIVCADYKFSNLYLAKKYLVKEAVFICLDGNAPLPFDNKFFSAVLCSDALHYIKSKHLAVSECRRVINDKGILLFSHLHNALRFNHEAGWPLSPHGYRRLFDGFRCRILPEERVLGEFLYDDKLDLTEDVNKEEINRSSAVAIVATENDIFYREHENIFNAIYRLHDNIIINPLYKVRNDNDEAVLTRNFPSGNYEEEYAFAKKYMPERYRIKKSMLESVLGKKDPAGEHEEELMNMLRKFILLSVPENYI